MKLRDYQVNLLDGIWSEMREHGPGCGVLAQSPTGSGKTIVGVSLANVMVNKFPDRPHCWVTDREQLHNQSAAALIMGGLLTSSMPKDKPSERHWYNGVINIVSPQLRIWPELPDKVGLMIVDEGHHIPAATWSRLVDMWQAAGGIVVAFTATPYRLNKRQGFVEWFDVIIKGPTVEELQEQGYLATPRVILPQLAHINDDNAEVASTGDFAFGWMESEVSMLLAQGPVYDEWLKITAGRNDKRTMWFVPTVYCGKQLRRLLGLRSRLLTAETPEIERREIMRELMGKEITHLISVNVLSEGVDVPSVPIIASLRPTQSLAVWLQQCGRGSRPKNRLNGGYYTVIDYAGNSMRHGPPDMFHDWSLEPREKSKVGGNKGAVAAYCYTDTCRDVILHPAHRECWRCKEEQYMSCIDCKVHRRWTQYSRSGGEKVCNICVESSLEIMRIKRRQQELNERKQKRDDHSRKRAQAYRFLSTPSDNQILATKIPKGRPKKPKKTKQLTLF